MMNIEKKLTPKDYLLYALFFLYVIDFRGMGNYLVLVWGISVVLFTGLRRIKYDINCILLIFFGITYVLACIINSAFSAQTVIRYLIAPVLSYTISMNWCDSRKKINYLMLIVVLGLFLHAFLNYIYSINNGYTLGEIKDIWGGYMATTHLSILLIPICSLFEIGFVFYKKNILYLLLSVLAVISLFITLTTGRRTVAIVFLIMLIINLLIDIVASNEKKRSIRVFLFLIIGLIVIIILYSGNMFGIKNMVEESFLYQRVVVNETDKGGFARWDTQIYVLKNIDRFLLGSNGITESSVHSYAHNLWLDALVFGGIIPAVTLVMYSINCCKTLKRIFKIHGVKDITCRIYISIFIASTLSFFVEPILQGAPHSFILFCSMTGAMTNYLKRIGG